jgi:hypothetical protein
MNNKEISFERSYFIFPFITHNLILTSRDPIYLAISFPPPDYVKGHNTDFESRKENKLPEIQISDIDRLLPFLTKKVRYDYMAKSHLTFGSKEM